MQRGEHGLATLVNSSAPSHPTPDLAAVILRSSQVFSGQQATTEQEARIVAAAVEYLQRPCTRNWVAARAVTLLSHYYQAATDAGVVAGIAEDWCALLEPYPAWAVANACRWWLSRENPRKHLKPIAGDIQERAHIELERVRVAQLTLSRGIALPINKKPAAVSVEDQEHRRAVAASILGNWQARGQA
jgi:hypothetical protein